MNKHHHGIIRRFARQATPGPRSLLRDTSGSNAVEYALLMGLVGGLLIISVLAMSGSLGDLFEDVAVVLEDPAETPAGGIGSDGGSGGGGSGGGSASSGDDGGGTASSGGSGSGSSGSGRGDPSGGEKSGNKNNLEHAHG